MKSDSMSTPLVSLIVPVYNVSQYISTCLDSAINQSYNNIEIIVVDDGSTDESFSICQEYASRDSRIKLIHQENKGLASARNTGIRAAQGDYIYFIDSDDCINVKLIEYVVGIAEETGANIVQIGLRDVNSGFKDYDEALNLSTYKRIKYTALQSIYNLERSKTKEEFHICLRTTVVWDKLYRTSAFETLLFPEGMRMHEDQMVAHRNYIASEGMIFADAPLYYYRHNDSSLIRVGWTPKRLSIFDCYEDRLASIRELKIDGAKELADFVYYRYLVCIIRNYMLADKKLQGTERENVKESILTRMKKSLTMRCVYRLSFTKKLLFEAFSVAPGVVSALVRNVDKIRGR